MTEPSRPPPARSARKPIAFVVAGVALLAVVVGLVSLRRALSSVGAPRDDDGRARESSAPPPTAPSAMGAGPPAETTAPSLRTPPSPAPEIAARAQSLVNRLAGLWAPGRVLTADEQREVAGLEEQLAALGDAAVTALAARLDARRDEPAARELLFNVLRKLPGPAVDGALAAAARTPKAGDSPGMRTMAIESLAARRTDQAFTTLSDIAHHDPELPSRPLIPGPRDPSDTSTELPDETVFSPRMQAMSALAATRDPRAIAVLTDAARTAPDESLRMEAARSLQPFQADPRATEALRTAARTDPSAYVRLAALHSLEGATDPSLAPLLTHLAAHDPDAGVRLLASRLQTSYR